MQKDSTKLPLILFILLSLLLLFAGYWKLASLLIVLALFFLWRTDSLVVFYLPKKVLFALLVLLLFVATYFHGLFPGKDSRVRTRNASVPLRQDASTDFPYMLSQADASTAIYTVAVPDTSLLRVEARIAPLLTLSDTAGGDAPHLVEFEIRDISLQGNKLGHIVNLAPPHVASDLGCYGWYLQDCHTDEAVASLEDAGSSIRYGVVVTPSFLDEVSRTAPIQPKFVVVITDLGTIDHQEIMSRDGHYDSARVAEYAGLDLNNLGSKLNFNVYMLLENGDSALIPVSIPLVWR